MRGQKEKEGAERRREDRRGETVDQWRREELSREQMEDRKEKRDGEESDLAQRTMKDREGLSQLSHTPTRQTQ